MFYDKLMNSHTNKARNIENSAISILRLPRYVVLQITARKKIFGINIFGIAVSSQSRIFEYTMYRTISTFEAPAVSFHQCI